MVILAITPHGLQQALQLPKDSGVSIWCGSDAISESEYKVLTRGAVSRFVYPLAHQDAETLADAVSTVEEHHPNETVLIEHLPNI